MPTGKIKSLVKDRGFGFIEQEGSPDDVFFHRSSITAGNFDDLRGGEAVEFEIEPDPRNPRRTRAGNVRISD